jgi:hypothetical protein
VSSETDAAALAARMRRHARLAALDHPAMQVGGHLEDAAGDVEEGRYDGAERHLRASMQSLTPLQLVRHGQHTDDEHLAARKHIALLDRHLLGVRDIRDAASREQDQERERAAGPVIIESYPGGAEAYRREVMGAR